MTIELAAQVACVKRELAMRRSAYPRWIQAGKMKQAKADEEIAAMEAVLRTLQGLLQPGLSLEGDRHEPR